MADILWQSWEVCLYRPLNFCIFESGGVAQFTLNHRTLEESYLIPGDLDIRVFVDDTELRRDFATPPRSKMIFEPIITQQPYREKAIRGDFRVDYIPARLAGL